MGGWDEQDVSWRVPFKTVGSVSGLVERRSRKTEENRPARHAGLRNKEKSGLKSSQKEEATVTVDISGPEALRD